MRILIVDDDEQLRGLLSLTLPTGFDLIEAADGEQAIEAVRERVPDLVVLDWRMPGRSGGEVLGELRACFQHLPVIVLTAEHAVVPRQVAEALRADAFLTKPFSPLELLGEVERLLAERATNEPA